MFSPFSIVYPLIQAVVLLFISLSLAVAFNRVRVHLPWLIPLAIGQALGLISGLSSLLMMSLMTTRHVPFSQMSWLLVPQQIVYGLATLTHVWFAVALFLTLKSSVLPFRQTAPPQVPGSWPPPPSV